MHPNDTSACAQAALAYARRGWWVFPVFEIDTSGDCACGAVCNSPGKHPRVARGFHEATREARQIERWWRRWPAANIGVRTGRESGLVVLDIDPDHDGDESIAILEEHNDVVLPFTLCSNTGGGGRHLLFDYPQKRAVRCTTKLGGYAGLDLRGDGGYFIAPPSNHRSGGTYRWQEGQDPLRAELAPLPSWVLEMRDGDDTKRLNPRRVLDTIPMGERNSTLTSFAGTMRRGGLTRAAIEAALRAENTERCDPALSEAEVTGIAKSVSKYSPRESNPSCRRSAHLVRLSDVEPEDVAWLWHPYIPLGKVTLLEGDPDLGKTFVSLALAAAVTRGWSLPNSDGVSQGNLEPGHVLFFTAEDGLADTLRPRFDAMGGDASRFFAPEGWRSPDGKQGWELTLQDRDLLDDAFSRVKPALAIFDPLLAYMGAKMDMYRPNETRPVMAALAQVARDHRAAVVGIRHWTKSEKVSAIHKGLGSIDISAAARSILMVGEDPEQQNLRVLAHVKSNLAAKGISQTFELTANGGFRWAGPSPLDAADLLDSHGGQKVDERARATKFLEELLANGPLPSAQVKDRANSAGIAERTLKRAKVDAHVISRREGKGWFCELSRGQPRGPIESVEESDTLDAPRGEAK